MLVNILEISLTFMLCQQFNFLFVSKVEHLKVIRQQTAMLMSMFILKYLTISLAYRALFALKTNCQLSVVTGRKQQK